jgi:hypothetical protein
MIILILTCLSLWSVYNKWYVTLLLDLVLDLKTYFSLVNMNELITKAISCAISC